MPPMARPMMTRRKMDIAHMNACLDSISNQYLNWFLEKSALYLRCGRSSSLSLRAGRGMKRFSRLDK